MQFSLIVLINTLYLLVIQILGLKAEEKFFFLIQIPVNNRLEKLLLGQFFVSRYLLLITQIGHLYS